MSVKYGKFEMPQQIEIDEESATATYGRFIAEPFERGFGHTIGNSMRRITLNSLEAPSIISVRIEGIPHEYMPIEGVVEDMTNIILNLKGALLRKITFDDEGASRDIKLISTKLEISQEDLDKNKGQYSVTLKDIVQGGLFEVVNPDLYLFTVTKPFKRQIDLRIAIGRGYVPSERIVVSNKKTDEILIDAIFSPVRLVSYFVENTRVGQDTDFERLILEVTTDGRITPAEAVSFASQIGMKHFEVFNKVQGYPLSFEQGLGEGDRDDDELKDKLCLNIDEIELSVRSTNCLKQAGISTIGELVIIPEKEMLSFRNFGKKSLNEIKDKLSELNLRLGMDLSRFDLDSKNVTEKIKIMQEERKGKNEIALSMEG